MVGEEVGVGLKEPQNSEVGSVSLSLLLMGVTLYKTKRKRLRKINICTCIKNVALEISRLFHYHHESCNCQEVSKLQCNLSLK